MKSIKQTKIYVAGHRGMVGSAIARALEKQGQTNIVVRTSAELDLTNQRAVREFFTTEQPDQVYLAAGKVGWWRHGCARRDGFAGATGDDLIAGLCRSAAGLIFRLRRGGADGLPWIRFKIKFYG